jgi:ribosomal protein L7Ae-like RNA K-turn-binding protein
LGLARRAGGVVTGTEAVREALREGRARLVLSAQDASPSQLEKLRRTLAGHPAPHVEWGTREELGAAVGRESLASVAVTHAALAASLLTAVRAAEPAVNGAEA